MMKTALTLALVAVAVLGFYIFATGLSTGLPAETPHTYERWDGVTYVPLNAGHALFGLLLMISAAIVLVTTKHD